MFYIIFLLFTEGELQVSKEGKILGALSPGRAFGELAILYNCTRTASVLATQDGCIWVLDRQVFQAIMMKTSLERQNEKITFLKRLALSISILFIVIYIVLYVFMVYIQKETHNYVYRDT